MATEQDLLPTTIEKDYALGWILFGIGNHPVASRWIFKGGTCLKKCFFNTYRFSEDLDFTVPAGEPYEFDAILTTIREVAEWVASEAGIEFPDEGIVLEEYQNPRGRMSLQGRATFVGPLQMGRRSLQRVKFDITQDEVVVDTPSRRAIHHPYGDEFSPTPQVLCYSVNEILAEKSRALYERQGRARDVYDVVHISRAFRDSVNTTVAVRVLQEKFDFKGLPRPTVDAILDRIDDGILRTNWDRQLGHQLPVLPDVGGFIESLPDALAWWLEPIRAAAPLEPIPTGSNETAVARDPYGYVRGREELEARVGTRLRGLAYAARNHLCIAVTYHGRSRLAEPYSLRYPATGNILLYVWERERDGVTTGETKAYKLAKIEDLRVTDVPFVPQFYVEL